MIIVLENLPKVSLNAWYSGTHWSKRKKLKDSYIKIVKNQFKRVFSASKTYKVNYCFTFKSRALDASNCVAMVKMIEDIIFEDDSYKIVKEIIISSEKGLKDQVLINIEELN